MDKSKSTTKACSEQPRGRSIEYKADYCDKAREQCELGANDRDLAEVFGVPVATISKWKSKYSDFDEACKIAENRANRRVEEALYDRAAVARRRYFLPRV